MYKPCISPGCVFVNIIRDESRHIPDPATSGLCQYKIYNPYKQPKY